LTNNPFAMTILRQATSRKVMILKEDRVYIGGGGYPRPN
jgi:hypothetical protein